jgi:type I restriction enzyme, S subunit
MSTKLGNHISTQKGFAFKSKWYQDTGMPIVKVSNFTDDAIDIANLINVPEEIGKENLKYALRTGDVVIQTVGSWPSNPQSVVGKAIKVPKDANGALLNQNAVRLDPKNGLARKYLFYLLRDEHFKSYIVGCAQGAASQASITLEAIRGFDFYLPDLLYQEKIAAVLSAYDDLIENNTRRIQILEEMAQTIYRQWFVEFQYPGHEDVPLVDSGTELGAIPQGWDVCPFSELVHINPKLIVDKKLEKPYVGMNALSTNSMLIDVSLVLRKTGSSGAKFQNRDVLFPRITPSVENGKAGFVQILDEGQVSIGSTEIIVFREKELNPEYIYFLSREHNFRENAIKSMVGASGRQRVQPGCFDTYLVAKPKKKLLNKFAKIVSPMFDVIHTLAKKNANLRATRDLLLPRLVSGEVDVSGLEIEGE